MNLFVTVGSTRFDALVEQILDNQSELLELGFKSVTLQTGKSNYNPEIIHKSQTKLSIQVYDYKSSILDDIKQADVVVGHAGAGTCLEVLRLNKKLLVVINDTLMDNHQNELADELDQEGYLKKSDVFDCIQKLSSILNHKFKKFPPANQSKFEQIFDKCLRKANQAN